MTVAKTEECVITSSPLHLLQDVPFIFVYYKLIYATLTN